MVTPTRAGGKKPTHPLTGAMLDMLRAIATTGDRLSHLSPAQRKNPGAVYGCERGLRLRGLAVIDQPGQPDRLTADGLAALEHAATKRK